jgi:hypothetical protein
MILRSQLHDHLASVLTKESGCWLSLWDGHYYWRQSSIGKYLVTGGGASAHLLQCQGTYDKMANPSYTPMSITTASVSVAFFSFNETNAPEHHILTSKTQQRFFCKSQWSRVQCSLNIKRVMCPSTMGKEPLKEHPMKDHTKAIWEGACSISNIWKSVIIIFFLLCFVFVRFLKQGLVYSPGWPETHSSSDSAS